MATDLRWCLPVRRVRFIPALVAGMWLLLPVPMCAALQQSRQASDVGSLAPTEWTEVATVCLASAGGTDMVWFCERLELHGSCQSATERITGIRKDGTGYRVLLDPEAVDALHPQTWSTRVIELTASGDGQTLAALIPDSLAGCAPDLPFHTWLIDTRTGAAAELDPGWPGGITFPSFSEDGERIAYVATDAIGRYIITARRTSPTAYDAEVEVLFAPGGLGVSYVSQLSRDGESLVFIAYQGFTVDDPGFLYRYHMPSATLTRLVEEPLFNVQSLSVSRDGRRVVYGEKSNPYLVLPVHGVSGNGEGQHVVTPTHVFGSATISGDGRWVYFTDMAADFSFATWRVPWEGGTPQYVGDAYWNSITAMTRYAISDDGNLVALRRNFTAPTWPPVTQPVTLVHFGERWLTTYGSEQPGQPLHCDVGGAPGAAFTLYGSLYGALTRTAFGPLFLEPSRLVVLAQGLVDGPDNMTTVPLQVPDDPALEGIEYHFQALVAGAVKPGWTNRTTIRLGAEP